MSLLTNSSDKCRETGQLSKEKTFDVKSTSVSTLTYIVDMF